MNASRDEETLRLWRKAVTRPKGGDQYTKKDNDNIMIHSKQGKGIDRSDSGEEGSIDLSSLLTLADVVPSTMRPPAWPPVEPVGT